MTVNADELVAPDSANRFLEWNCQRKALAARYGSQDHMNNLILWDREGRPELFNVVELHSTLRKEEEE